VQRSVHIPNWTEAEVNKMYHWYERESGQEVAQPVIDRVYDETQGQPGLVSWLDVRYLYLKALGQAAEYATQLGVNEITLALFIDTPVDDANRAKYEAVYKDVETAVTVHPVFVEIGE
jgi:hypothetical protein